MTRVQPITRAERYFLMQRFPPHGVRRTVREVADEAGLTREDVRFIEGGAFRSLRDRLRAARRAPDALDEGNYADLVAFYHAINGTWEEDS